MPAARLISQSSWPAVVIRSGSGSTVPSSRDRQAAVAGEPSRRLVRPAQQRRLGERVGFERGRGERGGGDQAGPGGFVRGRVEQVVARRAVRGAPEPAVDAGRGDRAVSEGERLDRRLGQRVRDLDRELAAHAQVAAAVDGPAGGVPEPHREHVGREALPDAAGVEPDAGRAADRVVGDLDARPRRPWGRAWPRCAVVLRRVLPRAGARGGGACGRTRPRSSAGTSVGSTRPSVSSAAISPALIAARRSGEAGASPALGGVQAAELAVGPKARQVGLEVLEELPARVRRRVVGDEQPDVRAHAVEGQVGHDERVVSGAGAAGAGAAGAGAAGAGAAGGRGRAAGASRAACGRGGRRRAERRAARLRGGARRRGLRARRAVLDDPRDDHAPDDHLARRGRARGGDELRFAERGVGPGAHLEPEQRDDREERAERPGDHGKRPGLRDRGPRPSPGGAGWTRLPRRRREAAGWARRIDPVRSSVSHRRRPGRGRVRRGRRRRGGPSRRRRRGGRSRRRRRGGRSRRCRCGGPSRRRGDEAAVAAGASERRAVPGSRPASPPRGPACWRTTTEALDLSRRTTWIVRRIVLVWTSGVAEGRCRRGHRAGRGGRHGDRREGDAAERREDGDGDHERGA